MRGHHLLVVAILALPLGCAAGVDVDSPAPVVSPTDPGTDPGPDPGTTPPPSTTPPASTPPAGPSDDYPTGPYGWKQGDVVDPSLCFDGYVRGSPTAGKWCTKAVYDPDGTKGVRAFLLSEIAEWCSVCKSESSTLRSIYESKWKAMGIAVAQNLIENASRGPSTLATASSWRTTFGATWTIGIDPSRLVPAGTMPTVYVVDPRTMKIERVFPGWGSGIPSVVEAVAARNG